jgi:hypothetical protein
MRKGASIKHMALCCVSNRPAEIFLHVQGLAYLSITIFWHIFFQMLFSLKASKIICAKATLLWH